MPEEDIHHPHDKLFKAGFSDPAHAGAFLRSQLPEVLSSRIAWDALHLEPGSYVDSHVSGIRKRPALTARNLLSRPPHRGRSGGLDRRSVPLSLFVSLCRSLSLCPFVATFAVWHLSNSGNIKSWRGHGRIELPAGGKTLINVGSVGQPRDLCSDACYAICNPQARWVEFRRVAYDIAKARRKIVRAKLPPFVAQRLALGRQAAPLRVHQTRSAIHRESSARMDRTSRVA